MERSDTNSRPAIEDGAVNSDDGRGTRPKDNGRNGRGPGIGRCTGRGERQRRHRRRNTCRNANARHTQS